MVDWPVGQFGRGTKARMTKEPGSVLEEKMNVTMRMLASKNEDNSYEFL